MSQKTYFKPSEVLKTSLVCILVQYGPLKEKFTFLL